MKFFPRRHQVLLAIFFIYLGCLAVGVSHHEPWFDEAQAWLLGRDSRILQLMNEHLRYEGSPGLWHLILSLLAKAALPYESMHILAAGLALTGVLIFLVYSPFPLWIKGLFPFSYFILYQYAVIARSYALLLPIIFGLAALHPQRHQRPYPYALLLALLANVSLHGLIMAFCFGSLDVLDKLRQRKELEPYWIKRYALAFTGLFFAGLFAAWQLRFPSDHSAVHPKRDYSLVFALQFTANFLSNALTEQKIISGLVVGISLWHFWRTRVLSLFLAPVLVIGHLLAFVYSSPWHEGILFLLWVFCLWISFTVPAAPQRTSWNRSLVLGAMALVLLIQIRWASAAFTNDYKYSYSAAKQVAAYLQTKSSRSQIYATGFHSIAILPYFPGNIFSNYKQRYAAAFWDWSRKNTLQNNLDLMVLDAPDTIIHGIKTRFNTTTPCLPGYTSIKFTGHIFWKNRIFEEDSYIVYERIKFPPHPRVSQNIKGGD